MCSASKKLSLRFVLRRWANSLTFLFFSVLFFCHSQAHGLFWNEVQVRKSTINLKPAQLPQTWETKEAIRLLILCSYNSTAFLHNKSELNNDQVAICTIADVFLCFHCCLFCFLFLCPRHWKKVVFHDLHAKKQVAFVHMFVKMTNSTPLQNKFGKMRSSSPRTDQRNVDNLRDNHIWPVLSRFVVHGQSWTMRRALLLTVCQTSFLQTEKPVLWRIKCLSTEPSRKMSTWCLHSVYQPAAFHLPYFQLLNATGVDNINAFSFGWTPTFQDKQQFFEKELVWDTSDIVW